MATKKTTDTPQDLPFVVGQQEVIGVAIDDDPGDTFRKAVVQINDESADPANQLMVAKADVLHDFTFPNSNRPSQKLLLAEGTLTTKRLAGEAGIKSAQLKAAD